MIRLGAPIFMADSYYPSEIDDPQALARTHREKGYRAAYAPRVPLKESRLIRQVREAFAREDVLLGEVGYWGNLMDTDSGIRRDNREKMAESLALAEELGANCAVALAGSYCRGSVTDEHSSRNFSEDAFAEAVDMARYFIDLVRPKNSYFTYEIYQFGVVDSVDMLERLIQAVDREQFGVHLDLANLVNCPRLYYKSAWLMEECVKRFGNKIVGAHAKDVRLRDHRATVYIDEVPNGQGGLDIAACMRSLHRLPQTVPYLIEHRNSLEEYEAAAAYLQKVAKQENITL